MSGKDKAERKKKELQERFHNQKNSTSNAASSSSGASGAPSGWKGSSPNLQIPTSKASAAVGTGSTTRANIADLLREKQKLKAVQQGQQRPQQQLPRIIKKQKKLELVDPYEHTKTAVYHRFIKEREKLPAFKESEKFLEAVFQHDVVVLCGETGSGKTTQLPQILMEELAKVQYNKLHHKKQSRYCQIICTQPKVVSARSVSARVCEERGSTLGGRVGYQVRFEKIHDNTTELLFCTVGIFLRRIQSHPLLDGVNCVILDEVHERSLDCDFSLLVLRDLVRRRRGTSAPLKIVLMSATIDATCFIDYFQKNQNLRDAIAERRKEETAKGDAAEKEDPETAKVLDSIVQETEGVASSSSGVVTAVASTATA